MWNLNKGTINQSKPTKGLFRAFCTVCALQIGIKLGHMAEILKLFTDQLNQTVISFLLPNSNVYQCFCEQTCSQREQRQGLLKVDIAFKANTKEIEQVKSVFSDVLVCTESLFSCICKQAAEKNKWKTTVCWRCHQLSQPPPQYHRVTPLVNYVAPLLLLKCLLMSCVSCSLSPDEHYRITSNLVRAEK